ncbi:MAG: SDR family oxidoreductase [Candidatus Endonucleobacter bathymodioli]|uniref:SDR family oxidoreductase n=1 Tax=Candidatus Endonucleibacter bathymodioli TaxID=539814 RepID=A0AA90SY86_9GAMM|nr:SDR family oxidoreductase [Candidatus Endonucleobacter bathymodioli]
MNLYNKNIVITGAAQGLGQTMAIHLAQRGANLALIDLNKDKLETTVSLCNKVGVKVIATTADVSDESQIENAINNISETLGPLHGLINNAGILKDGLLVKTSEGKVIGKLSLDQWQSVININLTGVFLCGREIAAHMIEADSKGVIINIASISRSGNFGQSNYAAAKAGVVALTTTWAKELSRHNIRCAAIAPGMIETEMTAAMKPEAKAKINAGIPLGHMGLPEDIAQTAAFIFENDYINGRVIEVDGGLRL